MTGIVMDKNMSEIQMANDEVKLNTIQKREKLNEVFSVGDEGPGGAFREYHIKWDAQQNGYISTQSIKFQKGPRKENGSDHGILDSDLLEIVRHRLQCFQKGEYATRENALALTHIEEALLWMNKRVEDRIERNVLGTYNK